MNNFSILFPKDALLCYYSTFSSLSKSEGIDLTLKKVSGLEGPDLITILNYSPYFTNCFSGSDSKGNFYENLLVKEN